MSQLSIESASSAADSQPQDADRRPYKILKPRPGWQALNPAEIWQFRDLLVMLAQRDLRLRYKQTVLGVVWVVLQPLISAAIFTVVFSRVAKMPGPPGISYFLFAYTGMVAWNLFSTTLTKASTSLVGNANLVSKVYFPRLVLPLSTVFSSLIDFGVALVMLAPIMVITHVRPGPTMLTAPIWAALLLLLSTGIGLYAASLMVSYRDVQYILPVALQFLLYASPVAYAMSNVPPKLKAIYLLNPITSLLEGFRWAIIGRGGLNPAMVAYAAAFAVGAFVVGAYAFRRMERKFADVI